MAQKIILKKSTVAAKVPTEAQLDVGELAVNTADSVLYTKHSDGSIKLLSPTATERSKIADSVSSSDPRLTDAREWTGATVTKAEAEAGTASTRRAWTSQRVRQAINAWWQLVTSGFGRNLVSASNEQAARNVLQLTYPATAPTVGDGAEVMRSGAYGLGGTCVEVDSYPVATTQTGFSNFYNTTDPTLPMYGMSVVFGGRSTLNTAAHSNWLGQLYSNAAIVAPTLRFRASINGEEWGQPVTLYSSVNLLNIGTTPASARAALELTGEWVDLRPYLKSGFYYDSARNGRNSYPCIRKLSCGRVELDGVVSFNETSGPVPIGVFVNVPAEFRPTLTVGGLMFGDTSTPLSFGACNWQVTGQVEYSPPRVHGDIMMNPLTLTSPAQNGAISLNGIYWYMNSIPVIEENQQTLLTIGNTGAELGYDSDQGVGAVTSRSIEGYEGQLLKLIWTDDFDSLLEVEVSRVAPNISRIRVTIGTVATIVSLSGRGFDVLGGQVYYLDNPFAGLPVPGPVVLKLEAI